jgi:hypothetical protein
MKKLAVVVVMVLGLVLAGAAEAAKPRKRSRNANRVGPYGSAVIGNTLFGGDHEVDQSELITVLDQAPGPAQNLRADTEDTDLGYQALFGYRFNRYVAAELSLAHFGETSTTARGDLDLDGGGFVPASLGVAFSVGGPIFSVVGILPINDKFEVYGRTGIFLASSDLEYTQSVDGDSASVGGPQGDSSNIVFGGGATWHFNQVYSARLEYMHFGDVGQSGRTGKEEMTAISLGVVIRF